jgi:hypothetical protein
LRESTPENLSQLKVYLPLSRPYFSSGEFEEKYFCGVACKSTISQHLAEYRERLSQRFEGRWLQTPAMISGLDGL